MGKVYRARDTRLGREVAVKTLPEGFSHDEDRRARFDREARLLASLNHPNIAGIYGLEESQWHAVSRHGTCRRRYAGELHPPRSDPRSGVSQIRRVPVK
jgi:serine/threonine protein kinase